MENRDQSARNAVSSRVEEAINSLIEYGIHKGFIAETFDFNFYSPEELFKTSIFSKPADSWPEEDPNSAIGLRRALNKSHRHEEMLKKRVMSISKDIALQEQTYSELRRRLLGAGKKEGEIEKAAGKSGKLSSQITNLAKMLYQVQNPPRETTNAVECRISTGLPGTVSDVPVRLPMNASLKAIVDMLKSFVSVEAQCASAPEVLKKDLNEFLGLWQYQLLVRNAQGKYVYKNTQKVLLLNDASYRHMIKALVAPSPQKLYPLLTPVSKEKSKLVGKSKLGSPYVPTEKAPTGASAMMDRSPSPETESSRTFKEQMAAEGFGPVDWKKAVERMDKGEDITECDLTWIDERESSEGWD